MLLLLAATLDCVAGCAGADRRAAGGQYLDGKPKLAGFAAQCYERPRLKGAAGRAGAAVLPAWRLRASFSHCFWLLFQHFDISFLARVLATICSGSSL